MSCDTSHSREILVSGRAESDSPSLCSGTSLPSPPVPPLRPAPGPPAPGQTSVGCRLNTTGQDEDYLHRRVGVCFTPVTQNVVDVSQFFNVTLKPETSSVH